MNFPPIYIPLQVTSSTLQPFFQAHLCACLILQPFKYPVLSQDIFICVSRIYYAYIYISDIYVYLILQEFINIYMYVSYIYNIYPSANNASTLARHFYIRLANLYIIYVCTRAIIQEEVIFNDSHCQTGTLVIGRSRSSRMSGFLGGGAIEGTP